MTKVNSVSGTFAGLLREEAPVIRLRCEKDGQSYPARAGAHCPTEKAQAANASDNARLDDRAWRREHLRAYMRKRREHERAVYDEKQAPAEDEPPVRERKPPPKGQRKARWAARAEEMKTLAENMLMDEPRAMMKRLAQDYERMSEREE